MIALRTAASLVALVLAACKPDFPPEPPELDPGEHLLVTPRGNPDQLLGRTVTQDPNGGYIVSDERPPGCEVSVRRVPERWHRTYQQDAGRAAHIGTGKTPVGELQIKHGKSVRVDAEIDNLEVLEGDLRGCSGTVVKTVKVGTGKREFRAREETSADVKVNAKGVPVGAGGGKWKTVGRALEWRDPQAWAFSVQDMAGAADMRVELILMPDSLLDGDEFSIRILSARQVYLVVGFINESGDAGLLLPNSKKPLPSITAGGNVDLVLRAKLDKASVAQRDRFVLYAFSEQGDFDMFKPPQGKIAPAAAAKYFEELEERLKSIPSRRWTKTEGYLLIEPQAATGMNP